MLKTFRAAFVTSAFTAFSVAFLVSLAEGDAARGDRVDPTRGRAATHTVPAAAPQIRVIDTRRVAPATGGERERTATAGRRSGGPV